MRTGFSEVNTRFAELNKRFDFFDNATRVQRNSFMATRFYAIVHPLVALAGDTYL